MLSLPKLLLPLLFLIFVLSSCAKDKSASVDASSAAPGLSVKAYVVPSQGLTNSQKIAKNAKVKCAPNAQCSASVGLLSMAEPSGASQCTASLVADDIVVTNAHCVPDDLRKNNADCTNRVWMNFPAIDGQNPASQIACSRILISRGGDPETSGQVPDYAFMRLAQKVGRPVLRLSRAGMKDGEALQMEKVDPVPTPGLIRGLQHTVTCKAVQNTYFMQDFSNSFSTIAVVADCEARHGNSGSPLRAADGTVRGVLFGITEASKVSAAYAARGIHFQEEMNTISAASNFACLPIPKDVGAESFSPSCMKLNAFENNSYLGVRKSGNSEMNRIFAAQVDKFPAFSWFRWKYERGTDDKFSFQPTCILSRNVELDAQEKIGPLTYSLEIKIDRYTRFKSLTVSSDSPDAYAKVSKLGGNYIAEVGETRYKIAACPAN